MIITIDIGNSNILMGIFSEHIICSVRFVTKKKITELEIQNNINKLITSKKIDKKEISGVVIASVVPQLNQIFRNIIKKHLQIECYFLKDFIENFPLQISVDNKYEVGDDRLANSLAALEIYQENTIVIDFGTAITFDIISKKKGYQGGIIFPGVKLALKYLCHDTAQLTKVNIQKIENITGKNTNDAIKSGMFNGYIAMLEGLTAKIIKEHKLNFRIVITGGIGKIFSENTILENEYDENLTLKGLNILYHKKCQ
jgi:type III pantothenate kinase